MFPKTLQSFYENRKNIPIRAIFTKKYRMFPENRFKKVPVKRFCAKKSKKLRPSPISRCVYQKSKPFGVSTTCFLKNLIFFLQIERLRFKTAGIAAPHTRSEYPTATTQAPLFPYGSFPKHTASTCLSYLHFIDKCLK